MKKNELVLLIIPLVLLVVIPTYYSDKKGESLVSNNETRLNEKGLALYSSGKYQEAIEVLDQALKINPNNTEALQNRELIFERLNSTK